MRGKTQTIKEREKYVTNKVILGKKEEGMGLGMNKEMG